MANLEVSIRLEDEVLMPSVRSLAFAPGDTITFRTEPGVLATLCMNPEATAILSPQPATGGTRVAAGTSVAFEVIAVPQNKPEVRLQWSHSACPWMSNGLPGETGSLTISPSEAGGTIFPSPNEEDEKGGGGVAGG